MCSDVFVVVVVSVAKECLCDASVHGGCVHCVVVIVSGVV